ncbi:MAG: hypothetical protein ACUVUC_12350 [Thermoguttaceae bacterium]
MEEVQPPVIHLRDRNGNLVPVPGFRLEDFERMLRREHQVKQADQTPPFSLQAMIATGFARGAYAELTVEFRFMVREEGWVRVPLRLDQAVLRGEARYKGPGQQFVHFEPAGEGYVSWCRGGAGQEHQLSMDILVPLATVGEQTRLRLSAPRATRSELKLTVPLAGAVAEVSEGVTLLPPTSPVQGQTTFTAVGLTGDFELAWSKAPERPETAPPALEAAGTILAKLGGQGIDCEVKLEVRAFRAPLERFRLRLPEGAEIIPGSPSASWLVPMPSSDPMRQQRTLLEVRLPKKVHGPVQLQFNTRTSYEAVGTEGWCELAAYEVVGASRQTGHVAVVAGRPWRVIFGPLQGVRQVEELPEPLRHKDLLAGFEYYMQPCSLPVRVVQARPRVSVEPDYRLVVDADRATLQARLRYKVRVAEIGAVDVELPGWELEEVGPENLVAVDAVRGRTGLISIPLVQRTVGPLEVTIRATRRIPAETSVLTLELPRLRGDLQGSATLAVLPADNVELTPRDEALIGLAPQQSPLPIDLTAERADRQQNPLYYRGDLGRAVFSAGFRVHQQRIDVKMATQVHLAEQQAQVEQRLTYTIAYKRLDQLALEVPAPLAGSKSIEVLLDGKPQTLVDPPGSQSPSPAAPLVRKLLRLSPARIGVCELTVRQTVQLGKLVPQSSTPLTIRLVLPADGPLAASTVAVVCEEGLRVWPRPGGWSLVEPGGQPAGEPGVVRLSASRPTAELPLAVSLDDQPGPGSIVVDRAWVQTWLGSTVRQDRAVFRLSKSRKTAELVLPEGVDPYQVELWVDGKRAAVQTTPEGRLIAPLAGDSSLGPRQLEILYQTARPRSGWGLWNLELPHLGPGAWVHRTYWQLILPAREHLLACPAGFDSESPWRWNGWLWVRQPAMEQPQLEAWSGARHLSNLPAQTNRYLFSSLGAAEYAQLRTASRAVIVLAASGLVLVAGLMGIYVRALRHPVVLLGAAVGLGSAAALNLEPAVLGSQAAAVGLLLAILAAWLRRIAERRFRYGQRPGSSFPTDSTGRASAPALAQTQTSPPQVPATPASTAGPAP